MSVMVILAQSSAAPNPSGAPASEAPAVVDVVSPPAAPWTPSSEVINELVSWLNITMYVALTVSILAVLILGTMIILDRDRGEPVSATAPHIAALRIALGVMVISGAASLAEFFS